MGDQAQPQERADTQTRIPEMRLIIGSALVFSLYFVTLEATPVDAGYMAPRPHMPRMDPMLLEELYERGLLEPVALPVSAGLEDEAEGLGERPKRRWWGDKYKDNKSYGFWITALNKAGNWKKRSYPDY